MQHDQYDQNKVFFQKLSGRYPMFYQNRTVTVFLQEQTTEVLAG